MHSRTGSARSHGRFALRRVCCAALAVLVLTLAGGVPQHAQAQDAGKVIVQFSGETMPIGLNAQGEPTLCQGQKYKLFVQGATYTELQPKTEPFDKLYVAQGTTNPIDPLHIALRAHWPAATFIYTAKNKGNDALTFEAYYSTPAVQSARIASKTITVEVRECTYKVTFVYSYQVAVSGMTYNVFGLMQTTRLEPKEDGTFEGSGPFVMTQLGLVPGCTMNYADVPFPTHVSGNLNQNTHELALTFKYDKATYSVSGACDGGSASASTTLDISQIMVTQATFPETGGVTDFPTTQSGGPPGKLTIIVNQEETNIAR